MSIWFSSDLPWFSFVYPVAKRPCQKSAIFSSSGFLVVTMRYIQLPPAEYGCRSSDWSTWNRRMMSCGRVCGSPGLSRSSTVAS